jgi:hypothetical protein
MQKNSWASTLLTEITEATANYKGMRFLAAQALCLTRLTGVRFAFVTIPDEAKIGHGRTLAFADSGNEREPIVYDLARLPCRAVLDGVAVNVPCNIMELYPAVQHAQAYCGYPLKNVNGDVIGLLAIEDVKALTRAEEMACLLRWLACRTSAELELELLRRANQATS